MSSSFPALIVALLVRRSRQQRRSEALLKGSLTSEEDEDDVRENMYNYDIEGGGEEDNANYDITALQQSYLAITPPTRYADLYKPRDVY